MATTTTNYGFDIPQSTDLVKDGATAIATLGQDIDTAMNTALGTKKAGMVLLNTTSFSGVASQTINDVFSATYDNYYIMVSGVSDTTSNGLFLRMRVAGADNTSSNYYWSNIYNTSTSPFTVVGNGSSGAGTSWELADAGTRNMAAEAIIYRPFLSTFNTAYKRSTQLTDASRNYQWSGGGGMTVNTSYTGFTIFLSANLMTGSVQTYGFNK
jgi:hypothetical protein